MYRLFVKRCFDMVLSGAGTVESGVFDGGGTRTAKIGQSGYFSSEEAGISGEDIHSL